MSNDLTKSQNNPTLLRAKSFKVTSSAGDYSQYTNVVKAYALAGMPFEHIANAGDSLGHLVERSELDLPVKEDLQKVGEVAEEESQILAWQNRGETITVAQIATPNSSGTELVNISESLTVPNQDQSIKVVEGIAVTSKPAEQVNNSTDNQLTNNPYLKKIT